MTKPDPATNTKASIAKRTAVTLWSQAFGEPPPVIANEQLMEKIINDYEIPERGARQAKATRRTAHVN